MGAYYNEWDAFAAQWLRNLIKRGLLPDGEVDERSIGDVRPDDLRRFSQCHFFAGIGGWPFALRLSGWEASREVWSGSVPCQPFSVAGKRAGFADERDLWPAFYRLVRECRPSIVFGEQVSGAAGRLKPVNEEKQAGRRKHFSTSAQCGAEEADQPSWLSRMFSDLEDAQFTVWASDMPACGVAAPHIRRRLYWCAMGQSISARLEGHARYGDERDKPGWDRALAPQPATATGDGGERVADASGGGRGRWAEDPQRIAERGDAAEWVGFWSDYEWRTGADGKLRRVGLAKPGLCGVADGLSAGMDRMRAGTIPLLAQGVKGRVGKLRGYGNAIVPQLAAEFVKAVMEAMP